MSKSADTSATLKVSKVTSKKYTPSTRLMIKSTVIGIKDTTATLQKMPSFCIKNTGSTIAVFYIAYSQIQSRKKGLHKSVVCKIPAVSSYQAMNYDIHNSLGCLMSVSPYQASCLYTQTHLVRKILKPLRRTNEKS